MTLLLDLSFIVTEVTYVMILNVIIKRLESIIDYSRALRKHIFEILIYQVLAVETRCVYVCVC